MELDAALTVSARTYGQHDWQEESQDAGFHSPNDFGAEEAQCQSKSPHFTRHASRPFVHTEQANFGATMKTVFAVRIHSAYGVVIDTLLFASLEGAQRHAERIQSTRDILRITKIEIIEREVHP